ncbi:hypothetical protein Tco_1356806 [Tanacetum coccineum]
MQGTSQWENLVMQYRSLPWDDTCTKSLPKVSPHGRYCTKAKDDLRNAYEKCNDISQESRALIDTFLKEGSDKDYELNLSMYGKAAKVEKQMDAKLAWLLKKYLLETRKVSVTSKL